MRTHLYAAAGTALLAALVGCVRPRPSLRLGVEPEIRVRLATHVPAVNLAAVRATAGGEFGTLGLPDGAAIRIVPRGRDVAIEGHAGASSRRIRFRSGDASEFVFVDGRPYRGVVEVYADGTGVSVVNVVGLEGYLQGVVTAEMGPRGSDARAALEAQAMVSRTYALQMLGRHAASSYDIEATVSDQRYLGVEGESPSGIDAVRRTAGRVVTYRGSLIDAFFHSTCGYSTASPEEAFETVQRQPYLEPVSDGRPGGGYYNDISPLFRWSVTWTEDELIRILRRTVPALLGIDAELIDEVRDVHVHRRGPSGRAVDLRVTVSHGQIPVPGFRIRQVLETPDGKPLNSNAFEIAVTTDAAGRLTRLTLTGLGAGHGVGLCQWGAIGRARAGFTAGRIVASYFPDTQIERWY